VSQRQCQSQARESEAAEVGTGLRT
jgi:hypothetical protein